MCQLCKRPSEVIMCIPCNVYILDGLDYCVLFFLDRVNNFRMYDARSRTNYNNWVILEQICCWPPRGKVPWRDTLVRCTLERCTLGYISTGLVMFHRVIVNSHFPLYWYFFCWVMTKHPTNRVILEQACSWQVRRQPFAIIQCIDLPPLQQWGPSVYVEENNESQHHTSTAWQNLVSSNVAFAISQSEREYSYLPLLPNYFNLLEMKIVGKEFPFCKYPTPSFNTFTFGWGDIF